MVFSILFLLLNSEIRKYSFFQAVEPLLETLKQLTNSPAKSPTIFLTQEMRDSDIQKRLWEIFFAKISDIFQVEKIPEEEQHANFRSADILLLKITKK